MIRSLLILILLSACQQPEVLVSQDLAANLQLPDYFDPDALPAVLGEKDAYLAEKYPGAQSEVPTGVPTIDVDLGGGAVYYEIQRCAAGANLLTATDKDPLTERYPEGTEALKKRDYRYVWGMAAAGACTLLEGTHLRDPFVDDFHTEKLGGTKTFNFFYILRPCVRADRSIYGSRRVCSYAFKRTKIIENYTNEMALDQRKLRAKLAVQGASLEYSMVQMAGVVRDKASYLEKCEYNEAQATALKRRLAGIAKIYLTTYAAAAGAILSGGTAAFLAGSATIKLADKLFAPFSNAVLNCPTDHYDGLYNKFAEAAKETAKSIGETREQLQEIDLSIKQPVGTLPAVAEACGKEGIEC